jgi:hypothetical protein
MSKPSPKKPAAKIQVARIKAELQNLMPKITLVSTLLDLFGLAGQLGGDLKVDTNRFRLHLISY